MENNKINDGIDEPYNGKSAVCKENLAPIEIIGQKGAEERDDIYTNILKKYYQNYTKDKRSDYILKKSYFVFVKKLSIWILIVSSIILLLSIFVQENTAALISVTIGAIVSIITALIAIPLVITKHLFPEERDKQTVDVVNSMIQNDCEVRKAQGLANCNNIDNKN